MKKNEALQNKYDFNRFHQDAKVLFWYVREYSIDLFLSSIDWRRLKPIMKNRYADEYENVNRMWQEYLREVWNQADDILFSK
jgi:hypothetical protein